MAVAREDAGAGAWVMRSLVARFLLGTGAREIPVVDSVEEGGPEAAVLPEVEAHPGAGRLALSNSTGPNRLNLFLMKANLDSFPD